MIDSIIEKYMSPNSFKVGDRVRITRKDTQFRGKMGVIDSIDGEYIYVQVTDIKSKPIGEFYRNEIEKV